MYNESGSTGQVLGAATTIGTGVAVLPMTGESPLGLILAGSAIAIGTTAIISQIVVRLVRRHYEK